MRGYSTARLLDLIFIILVASGLPSSTLGAETVTTADFESSLVPNRVRTSSLSSKVEQIYFQDNQQQQERHHHHHHHYHALPLSSVSSTSPPSLRGSSWLRYTSGNDNEVDEKVRGNYNYEAKNSMMTNNNNGNNNGNINNSRFSLMFTEPTTFNESMEDGFPNGTDQYDTDEGDTFEASLPWWRQMIWSILFGAMVVVACTGNVTVIWIVLAHKRMRTVTNYLLVNLSIADAMSSTLNVIPNYSFMLTGHWPFGALYCKIVQFVSMLSICASVFSLMAIAFDRYMAIMNPLRPRMGKRLTLGIAAGIWIGGTILSMPTMIVFQTFEKLDSGKVICYAEWPDGAQTESYQEYLYNVFFMIFTYFIPIAVMGYTYTRVGIELWGSKSIGECTQRQLDNIKSKRRVVKMMIVVVAIFAFCWLPFHMYFIWVSLWPKITTYSFVQEVYLGFYWLAMSNSMYNPMIYCWMNGRFRRGFQQVFRWCPFVHYSEVEATTAYMMHTQRERETTRYSVTGSPELQLTRVSRNGSGSVHIHLHVLTNDTGRSPSKGLMNMNSSSGSGVALPVSSTSGHNHASGGHHHHHNGNVSNKHQSGATNNYHQHHAQCHHLQRNFSSSSSSSRGNTMV